MKKILFTISILAILFSMSNCDTGIGLGGSEINNIFSNNEWEWLYKNSDNEVLHYKKITFTNNTFSFYEKTNYNGFVPDIEKTYTGTYSLSYDNDNVINFIHCNSDSYQINGNICYSLNIEGIDYPNAEKIWFWDSRPKIEGCVLGGVFDKI